MTKPPKKIYTDDACIDAAEAKLNIKYPEVVRKKLKERNGFYWGGYNFYCVYDEADKFHTFDDVVRENENDSSGWKKYLPEGYVTIASEDSYGLLLKTDKDGIVYYRDAETGLIEPFATSEEELESKLDESDREMEEGLDEDY